MRLPSVLLAVSAATLLASGSALSADANQGTKVSVMASPDLGVLDVSLNAGDEKRSLRGLKVVDEEDEERLAGANMFSIEKLTKAMGDANYAKTLMRRWKRHGIEIKDAKKILENSSVGKNPKLNVVYRNYAAWLDKHFPLGAETTGGKNLFSKAKIDQALEDSKYAKTLFGRWKSHGYESDDVFTKLKTMGLKIGDGTLDKMYRNYLSWLNVHHPDNETIKLAVGDDLFKESMLQRARGDDLYAESLFRAWKTKGLDVPENLKSTLGNVDNTLLEKYNTWLQTHFPRKVKTTRS
ncbi:hypothetical protein ON010_g6829 [Phytophthora cinnamomi]|nr:hypothetical protein ON010_g6829 [Phytophthora cinnamomi]